MAILISRSNRPLYGALLEQYFQLRHRVFNQWLGWDLEEFRGLELDRFDTLTTTYILTLDRRGMVDAGCRLIPTTEPNLIADVFPEIWTDGPVPCDEKIIEMSRFAIDWDAHGRDRDEIRRVSGEMACAIMEYCVLNDIDEIVTLLDTHFEPRVSMAFGAPKWKSAEQILGKVKSVAARYAVSYPKLRSVRQKYQLPYPSIDQFAEIVHA